MDSAFSSFTIRNTSNNTLTVTRSLIQESGSERIAHVELNKSKVYIYGRKVPVVVKKSLFRSCVSDSSVEIAQVFEIAYYRSYTFSASNKGTYKWVRGEDFKLVLYSASTPTPLAHFTDGKIGGYTLCPAALFIENPALAQVEVNEIVATLAYVQWKCGLNVGCGSGFQFSIIEGREEQLPSFLSEIYAMIERTQREYAKTSRRRGNDSRVRSGGGEGGSGGGGDSGGCSGGGDGGGDGGGGGGE
ncbi:hypothetical protein VNI00_000258 [Paramarasmius palmivorus]|uniref:DUF6593 domain-containing protein n=1 Tax=Paramarasmius palmivorus TaxID=297713 RepID=A0AAW0EEV1_9AGAR